MKLTTFHSQTVKTPQVHVKPEDPLQLESAPKTVMQLIHNFSLLIKSSNK